MSKHEEWYGPLTRGAILTIMFVISWVLLGLLSKAAVWLFNLGWDLL